MTLAFAFDNTYARLPDEFFARLPPTPVARPGLIRVNRALARDLGLDPAALAAPEGLEILAGNRLPEGAEPLAQAYAGHQFGGFVPQLGDGRAILLGEVLDAEGNRRDVQLKGAGRTPFSRHGDGRAWIGPVIREYLVSEAMHALGVPTTRALAAVTTGEEVWREQGAMPGAVLTRVAASHLRVGTFEYFAARRDRAALARLVEYTVARHHPQAAEDANPPLALLQAVVAVQARLVARWMCLGFVHGVMNTDNTSLAGETIDYGPCAFMEAYHPATVFSSIDHFGRYAWGNQPRAALWNLAQFANCLVPLIDGDGERAVEAAKAAIDGFHDIYADALAAGFRAKLGLAQAREGDMDLAQDLLSLMQAGRADFTLAFRHLADQAEPKADPAPFFALFATPEGLDEWLARWRARLADDGRGPAEARAAMRSVSPAFIPRNHRVEAAIAAAVTDDLGPFRRLADVLEHPYEDQPGAEDLMTPAPPGEAVEVTFCGT